MASVTRYAGTGANDASVGELAWNNPQNITSSDNTYTTNVPALFPKDYRVSVVKADGAIGTTNKKNADTWSTTESFISYGASNDLWGETLTADDINNSNFGVVLEVDMEPSDPGTTLTNYLKGTNFGFSIPSNSTINGIVVEIERKLMFVFFFFAVAVDSIRITIHYTETTDTANFFQMF